jgi:hypothetical protein
MGPPPRGVLVAEALLDLRTGEAFPAAVADLGKAVARLGLEAEDAPHDRRRLHRPRQGAAVHRPDRVLAQALAEAQGLPAALVGEVHPDGAREAVLGGQLRRAMAYQEEAGRRHGGILTLDA